MPLRRLISAAAPLALLLRPAPVSAQFLGPLEDLFSKVDGVTIFVTVGGLSASDRLTTSDFLLGTNVVRGMGAEVLIELSAMEVEAGRWGLELAFGVDYLTGFLAREPTLDLRGSARGLPTLSAYATAPVEWGSFGPYLGLNVGFVQLWNARAYDPEGREYDLDGDTFQLGLAGGVYHRSGFFLETSYRVRDFRSVDWELPTTWARSPRGGPGR